MIEFLLSWIATSPVNGDCTIAAGVWGNTMGSFVPTHAAENVDISNSKKKNLQFWHRTAIFFHRKEKRETLRAFAADLEFQFSVNETSNWCGQ